jgi:predicted transcriptional regulator
MNILGNSTRRSILRKISEGPDYALRIADELGLGQQLVSKHLDIIQEAGLVDVYREKSPLGARRKMYTLNKYYSLRIDFSPNLYNEGLISFKEPLKDLREFKELRELKDLQEQIANERNKRGDIEPLGRLISEIDDKLDELEKRRAGLLYLRNRVMKETARSMESMDRGERRILHQIIDRGRASVERLSRNLRLREETIRGLLDELEEGDLVRKIDKRYELKEGPKKEK